MFAWRIGLDYSKLHPKFQSNFDLSGVAIVATQLLSSSIYHDQDRKSNKNKTNAKSKLKTKIL